MASVIENKNQTNKITIFKKKTFNYFSQNVIKKFNSEKFLWLNIVTYRSFKKHILTFEQNEYLEYDATFLWENVKVKNNLESVLKSFEQTCGV